MMRPLGFIVAALAASVVPAPAETAEDLLRQGRLPEAERAFTERIRVQPDDAEAHHQLGRLALRRREFGLAIPMLEAAVKLRPENALYQFHYGAASAQHADTLGKTFRALGMGRRGRVAMERAVSLEPANIEFQQGLIEFYARAPGIAGGSLDKARTQAQALREKDPRAGTITLAMVHLRAKDPEAAFALYFGWLSTAPDDYQILYLAGRAAADTGLHLDYGIAALRRCLTLPPPPHVVGHATVHYHLARALQQHGDLEAARASYRSALELAPEYGAASEALKAMD